MVMGGLSVGRWDMGVGVACEGAFGCSEQKVKRDQKKKTTQYCLKWESAL